MKLLQTAHEFNTAIQNSEFFTGFISGDAKVIRNRIEVSFYLRNRDYRLPFLFRCSLNGMGCHFISLPYYLEYSRSIGQLPQDLRELVYDTINITPEYAVAKFNLHSSKLNYRYWRKFYNK